MQQSWKWYLVLCCSSWRWRRRSIVLCRCLNRTAIATRTQLKSKPTTVSTVHAIYSMRINYWNDYLTKEEYMVEYLNGSYIYVLSNLWWLTAMMRSFTSVKVWRCLLRINMRVWMSWLQISDNLAMRFVLTFLFHQMPKWVWISTLRCCPIHEQPRHICDEKARWRREKNSVPQPSSWSWIASWVTLKWPTW